MRLTLNEFKKERTACLRCNNDIKIGFEGHFSGPFVAYFCPILGHYQALLSDTREDGSFNMTVEYVWLHDHYVEIDYDKNNIKITNEIITNEIVFGERTSINLNILDKYRANNRIVSRDGLQQIVRKSLTLRHFR